MSPMKSFCVCALSTLGANPSLQGVLRLIGGAPLNSDYKGFPNLQVPI
jgi:hypothetical protein